MLCLPSLKSRIVYRHQLSPVFRTTISLLLLLRKALVVFLLALRLPNKLGRFQQSRMLIQHLLHTISQIHLDAARVTHDDIIHTFSIRAEHHGTSIIDFAISLLQISSLTEMG
jgi:hypothetical protein